MKKKKKNQDMPEETKLFNYSVSTQRYRVERSFGCLKRPLHMPQNMARIRFLLPAPRIVIPATGASPNRLRVGGVGRQESIELYLAGEATVDSCLRRNDMFV
jgi:hypothetical protein